MHSLFSTSAGRRGRRAADSGVRVHAQRVVRVVDVLARNQRLAARAPAQREAAALACLLLHGATRALAPPNVVVGVLAAFAK